VRILGVAGSPRPAGNSTSLLEMALGAAQEHGHEVQLLRAVELAVQPCLGCNSCKRGNACVVEDRMSEFYSAIAQADILALSTPIYSYGMSGWLKAMVDRCHALVDAHNHSRLAPGKKLFVITAQADTSPADGIATANALMRSFTWFGLTPAGSLAAAGVTAAGAWQKRLDLQEAARRLLLDNI
jgi:multimeric flavodoxin WrbA